jgi:flagellar biosynthesis/type III secretory pathway chaperone
VTTEPDLREDEKTAETWETTLAAFLVDLSEVQSQVLDVLIARRKLLSGNNNADVGLLSTREEQVVQRLQECHDRRSQLLAGAAALGLPNDSIASLAAVLPDEASKREMNDKIRQARSQASILQHHSLTNWMFCQRALIHLSQMLEIIATGGRLQPTYGKGRSTDTTGSLVNREV